jgi:hypothetical protein
VGSGLIRLLLDQGLPRSTVEFLLGAGWDVVHSCQCGLATASVHPCQKRIKARAELVAMSATADIVHISV